MSPVVVTRHPALVDYLREIGLVDEDVEVVSHASRDTVEGRVVFGVLPLHLAAYAKKVVTVPLLLTPEDRGRELSIERVREIAGEPQAFVVREVRVGA